MPDEPSLERSCPLRDLLEAALAGSSSVAGVVERLARLVQAVAQSLGLGSPPPRPPAPPPHDGPDSAHKFDLGAPVPEPMPEHIPWGYGQDRITAMVVDPERLYAYWEVTDEAIERARAALGAGGAGAWLNLRVYDVTGRIFDGTNANSYFDHRVERDDRQWFFEIGRPASTVCVEVGLASAEGYFVRIARSGRADFPRRTPAADAPPEWLTVRTASGEVPAPEAGHAGLAAPPPTPVSEAPWPEGPGAVGLPVRETILHAWDHVFRGEWTAGHGVTWEGPVVRTSWEAGPFPFPVAPPAHAVERYEGPVAVQVQNGATRVVHAAWRVVIRGLGARAERRVLGVWEVRHWWTRGGDWRAPQAGAPAAGGASERRWLAASELRLGGASEIYAVGASEVRLGGASEVLYRGASEVLYRGASELLYRGASEWRAAGASEARAAGASERRLGGR